jgi:flagellar protein FlbD
MISLTRLSGSVFVLNADLIERLDSTPDTVITLVDGKKYVVVETMSEVVDAIRVYRSAVIAFGAIGVPEQHHSRPHLAPVTQHPASAEGVE